MEHFYDTHAHLDYPDYSSDLPEVMERAATAGISRIIAIGTDLASSERVVALSERFDAVHAVVGWHPCQAAEAPEDWRPDLRRLARHPKVVALGETGLDFRHLPSASPDASSVSDGQYRDRQLTLFRQHLEVAAEAGLNCVVHQRDALGATLEEMRRVAGRVRGVFHCFTGSPEDMRCVVDIGSLVSFTGIVTFKNAAEVRRTVAAAPIDSLMLETDCPYLAPVPWRGKRCEPAHVRRIAEQVAETRGCSLNVLEEATCRTARAFFRGLS